MTKKFIINDFKRNKFVAISMIFFIAMCSALFSLSTILFVNLSGSITALMKRAKTPDYLQMHKGDIDIERLEKFSKNHPNVLEFQVLEFPNINGEDITLNGKNQSDSLQDNGLSIQSDKFDFLLDLDNQIIMPEEGELYLPLMFYKDKTAKIGDMAEISGQKFIIKGFFRDSQMNSNMAGSKRFLLSGNDFEKLKNKGEMEYLIEFRLKDTSKTADFEKDYFDAGLETNGQMVTGSMFKMINGLSDGMIIAVLVLSSILILLISLLCIKLIIQAKIEEDIREIGVLRAIGLSLREIKGIYLSEYALFSGLGIVFGLILSFLFKDFILKDLFLYMGKSENYEKSSFFAFFFLIFIFLIIILCINGVLNKIGKISPLRAMRKDIDIKKKKSIKLGKTGYLNLNLAIIDLISGFKMYVSIFLIVLLTFVMIATPHNIKSTTADSDFITNFGFGKMDLILELKQGGLNDIETIQSKLENDKDINKYAIYKTISENVEVKGKKFRLKMDIGDHSAFPIKYIEGHAPLKSSEIALSKINSEDLSATIGDKIKMSDGRELEITGIYQALTSGGKTAKAMIDSDGDIEKISCVISFNNPNIASDKSEEYSMEFNKIKTMTISDYFNQSFGQIINGIEMAEIIVFIFSITVLFVVIYLFIRLITIKEKKENAIKKVIGFRNVEIKLQYSLRLLLLMIIALLIGVSISRLCGELLLLVMLSGFGLASVKLSLDFFAIFIVIPAFIILTVLIAQNVACKNIDDISLSNRIKEAT